MTVEQLFQGLPEARFAGNVQTEVSGLQYDSRLISTGQMFFAIQGFQEDGRRFISDAIRRGAAGVVSDRPRESATVDALAWVQVPSVRLALALAAAEYHRHPSRRMQLAGITGTNGKTTVSFLIASILAAAGRRPALFGTIEYRLDFLSPESKLPAPNTTPESLDLQRMLCRAAEAGGRCAVMEVSSHALALERVAGCCFHTAVWTNFSRDHLDFHPSAEDYYAAKAKLFLDSRGKPAPKFAILNADDAQCAAAAEQTPASVIRFGIEQPADVTAHRWRSMEGGTAVTAQTPAGLLELESALVGRHNVSNLLAATAAAIAMEAPAEAIQRGVRDLRVPGRMEAIRQGQPFAVYVDYAHTDQALQNLIASARELSKNSHLIIVFGCGGDRDRSKRPLMGLAAAACDQVILTSDNPRSEDPLQIINDVTVGLQKAKADYVVEPDRKRAIVKALEQARPGDIVLIAGKGHEDYQIVAGRRMAFDDRATARAALREMGYEGEG